MTPFDDDDLIDRLKSGIAQRQSGISAPDGIGDQARRVARKRTATRAVGAGVPVLAVAGVATVLAVSSGSGPTAAGGLSAGGSNGSALSVLTGPVKAKETAYIVKRVKARITDDSQNGTVIHTYLYASGDVSSDGSLVNLGPENGQGWDYAAPDGTFYQRNVGVSADRSLSPTGITGIGVTGRVVNGKQDVTLTLINPTNRTYSQTQTDYSVPANAPATSPAVDLQSSPSEVQRALQSGQVTQEGTTTVNGTQAIALSVTLPGAEDLDYTLYVDAQTYQPLRTVTVGTSADNSTAYVADWIPATPDNIAEAEDNSIPAGYTKVAHLAREAASHRAARVVAAR
jgi:hypothetical protein